MVVAGCALVHPTNKLFFALFIEHLLPNLLLSVYALGYRSETQTARGCNTLPLVSGSVQHDMQVAPLDVQLTWNEVCHARVIATHLFVAVFAFA